VIFFEIFVVSDLSHFRPVYAPKDFLEVIVSLRNPNYCSLLSEEEVNWKDHWGLIQVPLQVPTLKELVCENRILGKTSQSKINKTQHVVRG